MTAGFAGEWRPGSLQRMPHDLHAEAPRCEVLFGRLQAAVVSARSLHNDSDRSTLIACPDISHNQCESRAAKALLHHPDRRRARYQASFRIANPLIERGLVVATMSRALVQSA